MIVCICIRIQMITLDDVIRVSRWVSGCTTYVLTDLLVQDFMACGWSTFSPNFSSSALYTHKKQTIAFDK